VNRCEIGSIRIGRHPIDASNCGVVSRRLDYGRPTAALSPDFAAAIPPM